ncbi:MAG: recombinase family protein [Desulfitobacteriaceae bacterium]|nr:recombinase family protein [Desulfitobacteriaceae bacterium]
MAVKEVKIGYIRGRKDSHNYKLQIKFLESSNVEKIYHEQSTGTIELNALLDYSRSGDIVFIYNIEVLGQNVKTAIRFIIQAEKKNVTLIFKKEKWDTSSQIGKYVLEILSSFDSMSEQDGLMERSEAPNEKGRIPRELTDLRAYMKLVEKNEISVKEVCSRLNIGRTTYYRRTKELAKITIDEESEA